jgi:hypothetical protein
MRSIGKFGAVSLVLLAGLAVGCDKTVKITFTNQTPQPRNVQLTTPYGPIPVGTIAPGHPAKAVVKIRQADLPTQLIWQAGELSGTILVTKHSQGNYNVKIVQAGQFVPAQPAPGQPMPGRPAPAQPAPIQPAPAPVDPAPPAPPSPPSTPPAPQPPPTATPYQPPPPPPPPPAPVGPVNPN